MMTRYLLLACLLFFSMPSHATDLPYNEKADAHAELRQALEQAQQRDKKVLVMFGANWCPECRRLDKEIAQNKTALKTDEYVIVKVDVGNFDRNTDLVQAYGNVTKKGIPAAVVLTAANQVEYKGRLVHLTSPHKRYLKIAAYLAVFGSALLVVIGGALYLHRKWRNTNAAQPVETDASNA